MYDFTGMMQYPNVGNYIFTVTVTNAFNNSATVMGAFTVAAPPLLLVQTDFVPQQNVSFVIPPPFLPNNIAYVGLSGSVGVNGIVPLGGDVPGIADVTGSINLLTVDQGVELVLPPQVVDGIPHDLKHLAVNWGDGNSDGFDKFDSTDTTLGHIYADDSGKGTYTLTLVMTGADGKTTTRTYHVKVLNVAPTIEGAQWNTQPGPGGNHVVVSGHLTDSGIHNVYAVAVTWSDGSVTEQIVARGPDGWVFSFDRPAVGGLQPLSITATDINSPSSVGTLTLGAPRFGAKPGKQGALDPRHRVGPTPSHFAGTTPSYDLALALGAGAVVAARRKDRSEPATNGRIVMLSGAGASETDTGEGNNRLCIDAMLAAKLAGYERAKPMAGALAETRAMPAWRLPDDWKLAAAPSREAQALAQALADVIGDNDDWVVHDGNGDLCEAAE